MNLSETKTAPVLANLQIHSPGQELREVKKWEVGVTKCTLVKFSLPWDENTVKTLIPRELRQGPERRQDEQESLHVTLATALGKAQKTVAARLGTREVDTADERMETPKKGRVSATFFWDDLESLDFEWIDGQWFRYIKKDGSVMLVVELRFAHRNVALSLKEAFTSSGITPTEITRPLKMALVKNFFCHWWYRCFAFSNSAHLDQTKTYNFTGVGQRYNPTYELVAQNREVFFKG
jgi:hypothetical protein